ncbi:MAG: hypothetical protein KA004_16945 [Verrucomicrobiales bacterium]|nr:hypothetical protein [Verrucomicrobiales bacterium]
MSKLSLFFAAAILPLAACHKPETAKPTAPVATPPAAAPTVAEEPWIPASGMGDWKVVETGTQGEVSVKDSVFILGQGDGITGVHYEGTRDLPVVDYEIAWDGMKLSGVDFFAAATFPVRDKTTCATFINGGWGGGVTGISCFDGMAANENNTTSYQQYEDNKWYRFRVQITADMLVAYVDEKKVVSANIKNRKVSLRPGEIEGCAPLGFASWQTKGAVRHLVIRKLKPGEVPVDPDAY